MSKTKTVTIWNQGDVDLNLTGSPMVELSGVDASEFSLDLTNLVSPIVPGGSTTFDLIFDPTTLGEKSAQVSIPNDDSDENPYTINLVGTALQEQEMDVQIDGSSVPSGGSYNFGDIYISIS